MDSKNISKTMIVFVKTLSGDVQPIEINGRDEIGVEEFVIPLHRPGLQLTIDSSVSILRHEDVLTVVYTPIEFSSSDVQVVEDSFQRVLGSMFTRFKESIINHECVVAGGSVLAALHRGRIKDFDVYVHTRHAQSFVKDLLSLMKMNSYVHACPAYDESFLKKNHIMGRLFCKGYSDEIYGLPFDVMMVADDVSLEHVVSNFDLTFCQVWWDGRRIDATHVTDVRSRCGKLQAEYCQSFIHGNLFTQKRVAKYRRRGFTIQIDTDPIRDTLELVLGPKARGVALDTDHWKINTVLRSIRDYCEFKLRRTRCQCISLLYFRLLPPSWNWVQFVETLTAPVVHAFIQHAWSIMQPYQSEQYHELLPVIETDSEHIRREFIMSQLDQLAPVIREINQRLRETGISSDHYHYVMPSWRNL
jgi:hypothetical protein